MQDKLEQELSSYFGIKPQNTAKVAELFEPQHLAKDAYWLKTGQYCQKLSFIKSGYLRLHASSHNGRKEVTQWIAMEHSFVTDIASFLFHQAARWDIQALEDCELYTITKVDFQQLGAIVPHWSKLEQLFLAKCFVTLENRMFNQLSMSSEERYDTLFQYNPEIFNQVPLLYIASMLGMTPETLSRIRNKKRS